MILKKKKLTAFFVYGSSIGSKWGYSWRCMLAQHINPCVAWCSIEGHKPISSKEGDSVAPSKSSTAILGPVIRVSFSNTNLSLSNGSISSDESLVFVNSTGRKFLHDGIPSTSTEWGLDSSHPAHPRHTRKPTVWDSDPYTHPELSLVVLQFEGGH